MTPGDPTHESAWRPLFGLLRHLDDEIARIYAERESTGIRPRFTPVLIRLHHRGPSTIRELAAELDQTHSALSQTVAALRAEALVTSEPGHDARTKVVDLTARGRAVVPFLEDEWRATEAAIAELEAELPYPVTRVVRDLKRALATRSFSDRLRGHLP
ncbi:MAG: MarR family winged helix-turn-helix transcriptional regulator [Ornithinimicrobium sp.]|uniref:MarR family winged helix-turn-helix transcriptional regulator n=1 Tax=Ornithinimicrobium sp. TaxID=1977084 RepID=UPI003D9B46C2